ncbi:MAG TPA: FGGY family carbohydrate kinase [Solirubrobacteraceae bacterium]|jgi:sugar (pentulose or hexulose) kinase|nr:FGGY family carbohydrate kinase [Solirubrobacteraceae bacterium]
MSDGAWLGVDLGTQGVRALAVSARGEVLAAAERPLASCRTGPRHEQDPEEWWTAFTGVCREVTAALPSVPVEALAICGTSGTIALVDAAGAPLSPGLMYDDARAVEEAERVEAMGGEVWESLGYRMQPSWALPKLLWLLREHGDGAPGARLAHQVDFVLGRLLGRAVSADWSHALKTGYDLVHDAWPEDVMAALGVPEGVLPAVVRPGSEIGALGRAGAEASGIAAGTPVIAGMTDGCAAQLATGALAAGNWNSVLGTTLVLKGVAPELIHDPHGAVYSHRSPDGHWLPGGASSAGAGVLAARFPGRDLAELDRRAAGREPAAVLAYPLLSRGERFPFAVPEAEGFVLGEPADEADHFAALLQGVAYVERLCFDYLDHLGAPTGGELSLTGGATRSRYWCQLRADVLGRPVRLVEHPAPAFGMAVLAASRARPLPEAARAMVRAREVIDPRADRVERFREPYVRLVGELERRGWLEPGVAEHARGRATP